MYKEVFVPPICPPLVAGGGVDEREVEDLFEWRVTRSTA
jgi:hypothetical protein